MPTASTCSVLFDSWTQHFYSAAVNDQQNASKSQWILLMHRKLYTVISRLGVVCLIVHVVCLICLVYIYVSFKVLVCMLLVGLRVW
jgi:hypothetical protein